MTGEADVLVVGAGLSGLTAAHELRQRGISVRALEANGRVAEPWRQRHARSRLRMNPFSAQPTLQVEPFSGGRPCFWRSNSLVTIVTERISCWRYQEVNVDESAANPLAGSESGTMTYLLYPFAIAITALGTTLAFV